MDSPAPSDPPAGCQVAQEGQDSVLQATGLSRSFGPIRAVDGVSFTLGAGELLTVFGPNGAGKTTLLGILSGSLRPSEGDVTLRGMRLEAGNPEWHRRIGVLSHQSFLYGHLTLEENLLFFGRLFGLRDLSVRIPARLEQVGLTGRAKSPARTLSRGMRQRLALARTLLHDPDFVLLDEPYTGLDAHAASVLRQVLASLKDGHRTIILVTHNISQGLELADRVAILARGRFVLFADRQDLQTASFERAYREKVEEVG
ncbi:MAG: heme ABC exporter ATP-binding protein CcmA [Gemmatimonadetes bacterium]|nr:heme ABC exporter ATP-binding protein CcmA [Gemmatimonadota bacterium]